MPCVTGILEATANEQTRIHNKFRSHDTHGQTDTQTYKAAHDTVQRTHNNVSFISHSEILTQKM